MAKSLSEYFRAVAEQIEADEKAERDEQAQQELEQLRSRALSDDDRKDLEWVRSFRAKLEKDESDESEGEEEEERTAAKKPAPKPKSEDDRPERRVRPGRKSGAAYQWWVDDETGEVIKLDTARIYDGPDEPEEVEIPVRKAEEEAA